MNTKMKNSGVVILLTEIIDFRKSNITSDKEQNFLMEGLVHQKIVTTLNVYGPNRI